MAARPATPEQLEIVSALRILLIMVDEDLAGGRPLSTSDLELLEDVRTWWLTRIGRRPQPTRTTSTSTPVIPHYDARTLNSRVRELTDGATPDDCRLCAALNGQCVVHAAESAAIRYVLDHATQWLEAGVESS